MKTKTDLPVPNVPPGWHKYYRSLQSLRRSLMKQHGLTAADDFEHAMALGILAHQEDSLHEVNAAINRILDGSYGICQETGKPIPEARLRIVPWTRFSIEALERTERERMARRLPVKFFPRLAPA